MDNYDRLEEMECREMAANELQQRLDIAIMALERIADDGGDNSHIAAHALEQVKELSTRED